MFHVSQEAINHKPLFSPVVVQPGQFCRLLLFLIVNSLHPSYACGEVPGTHYGMSSNGWMNQKLFQGWFIRVFLEYIPPKRPVILLMDGHSSHYCPETIRMAAEHQVVLFALPPNTTHITQPLDCECFAPLKVAWQ